MYILKSFISHVTCLTDVESVHIPRKYEVSQKQCKESKRDISVRLFYKLLIKIQKKCNQTLYCTFECKRLINKHNLALYKIEH